MSDDAILENESAILLLPEAGDVMLLVPEDDKIQWLATDWNTNNFQSWGVTGCGCVTTADNGGWNHDTSVTNSIMDPEYKLTCWCFIPNQYEL